MADVVVGNKRLFIGSSLALVALAVMLIVSHINEFLEVLGWVLLALMAIADFFWAR